MHQTQSTPIANDILKETIQCVISQEYKWVERKAWEGDQAAFFGRYRPLAGALIFNAPSHQQVSKKYPAKLSGQWVLQHIDGEVCGWAEAQEYPGPIKKYFLSMACVQSKSSEGLEKAIGLFISSLFVAGQADLVELVGDDSKVADFLVSQCGLKAHSVYSFFPQTIALGTSQLGDSYELFRISAAEWWENPIGKMHKFSVKYLNFRREKIKNKNKAYTKDLAPRRRSSVLKNMIAGFMGRRK